MAEGGFPQGYESFGFSTSPPPCGPAWPEERPEWLRPLDFEVTEAWGTSATVRPGERYVLRGTYRLTGEEPFAVSLAVLGSAFGATAHLLPGEWLFETSTEVLELTGRGDQIGVVLSRGQQSLLVTWVTLVGPQTESQGRAVPSP